MSLFALSAERPNLILIGRELQLLQCNDFVLAWLAKLLTLLLPGGALLIEERPSGGIVPSGRLDRATFGKLRNVFSVSDVTDCWFKLDLASGFKTLTMKEGYEFAARPYFRTVYTVLHDKFCEFEKRYTSSFGQFFDRERLKPEFAERQFIYTLTGTVQKAGFIERLATDAFSGRRLRILDMGGGYGAMGAELAAQGHDVTVLEFERSKIQNLGEWIRDLCRLQDKLTFVVGDFAEIDTLRGRFDLISFFGSLLYQPHESVADLLRRCCERLSPGGLLVIHENPKDRANTDAKDYAHQFMAADLDRLVRENVREPHYFSVFTYKPIDLARAANSVILLTAAKS